MHRPRPDHGTRRLDVAAVGDQPVTVAEDALGFARPDRQVGRLAWTAAEGDHGVLWTADTATGERFERAETDANPLRRWGEWGFALLIRGSPGEAYDFELRNANGTVAIENVSGYPFGAVPGGALGVTTLDGPGAGGAVALDP